MDIVIEDMVGKVVDLEEVGMVVAEAEAVGSADEEGDGDQIQIPAI